jgi:hypothetical protein
VVSACLATIPSNSSASTGFLIKATAPNARARSSCSLCEVEAVHEWHVDVGDQEVYALVK